MGFEFIDSNGPVDPASRQRIRRQAALGKNLGRKLNRPSRKQAASRPQAVAPTQASTVGHEEAQQGSRPDEEQVVRLPRPGYQLGNTLTQLRFRKIGPDGLVMNAISFILQAARSQDHGIGKAVHTGKVPVFSRFMFQDEAYFHSTIALSLRALSTRPEAGGLPSMLAIQHMARALQLINSHFARTESISDFNIAVVVVMTQYTRMSGHMDECRIHLDGLERMVQLKGGINAIRPEIAEKIFRTDLGCAYHLSAPPRFSMDEVEQFSMATVGPGGILSKAQRDITLGYVRPDLIQALSSTHLDIFLDATRLTHVLDDAYKGKREWLAISTLHQATLYIGYQIVGAPQGTPNENSDVDLLARLGLVTFCLSFFRSFDSKIIQSSPLGTAIYRIIHGVRPRGRWSEELILWTIFIGHIVQIFDDDLWPVMMQRARLCMGNLELTSWQDALRTLDNYPWSDALHGDTGKILWDALMLLPASTMSRTQFVVPLR